MPDLGGLLCGLIQEDYGLISRSIHDVIAEPRRQKLIPDFYRAKRAAMAAGALGFSISGAGPSVFALCEGEATARKAGAAISPVTALWPVALAGLPLMLGVLGRKTQDGKAQDAR